MKHLCYIKVTHQSLTTDAVVASNTNDCKNELHNALDEILRFKFLFFKRFWMDIEKTKYQ